MLTLQENAQGRYPHQYVLARVQPPHSDIGMVELLKCGLIRTVETPRALLMNVVLLLLVSPEPFLLSVMVDDANVKEILNLASCA